MLRRVQTTRGTQQLDAPGGRRTDHRRQIKRRHRARSGLRRVHPVARERARHHQAARRIGFRRACRVSHKQPAARARCGPEQGRGDHPHHDPRGRVLAPRHARKPANNCNPIAITTTLPCDAARPVHRTQRLQLTAAQAPGHGEWRRRPRQTPLLPHSLGVHPRPAGFLFFFSHSPIAPQAAGGIGKASVLLNSLGVDPRPAGFSFFFSHSPIAPQGGWRDWKGICSPPLVGRRPTPNGIPE